jgi:hypothetical protein
VLLLELDTSLSSKEGGRVGRCNALDLYSLVLPSSNSTTHNCLPAALLIVPLNRAGLDARVATASPGRRGQYVGFFVVMVILIWI